MGTTLYYMFSLSLLIKPNETEKAKLDKYKIKTSFMLVAVKIQLFLGAKVKCTHPLFKGNNENILNN